MELTHDILFLVRQDNHILADSIIPVYNGNPELVLEQALDIRFEGIAYNVVTQLDMPNLFIVEDAEDHSELLIVAIYEHETEDTSC